MHVIIDSLKSGGGGAGQEFRQRQECMIRAALLGVDLGSMSFIAALALSRPGLTKT